MIRAPSWYTGPHAGTNNKIKKPRTKRGAPEHKFQASLVKVLHAHTNVPWFAIPNGGHRHLSVAMKLKAEGVKPGVPDLEFILPPDGRSAFLELKAPGGSLSTGQKEWRDALIKVGALWEMAENIDEALGILAAWDVLPSFRFSPSKPQE